MSLSYSLWYYLTHPLDVLGLIIFWLSGRANLHSPVRKHENKDLAWCYGKLVATSRSFSALILQLHENVRDPLCLFYIILRGLDTIEDDMKPSIADKKKHLLEFYKHLYVPGWKLSGYGNKAESDLLENFDKVINCFLKLKPEFRDVITDICQRMGEGMAEFLDRPIETLEDWDQYAHYVAGIVGHGLSRLWLASGLGHFPNLAQTGEEQTVIISPEILRLSNSVGVFLQKVNMIRDILEDVSEVPPRVFWPREVWSKYVDRIQDIVPETNLIKSNGFNQQKSVACLNELVLNAMQHVPDCLDYLEQYQSRAVPAEKSIFRFVGVATMMCMATLELCYDNSEVLTSAVKIPKGEALRIMQNVDNYNTFTEMLLGYIDRLIKKSEVIALENRACDVSSPMISQMLVLATRCRKDFSENNLIV